MAITGAWEAALKPEFSKPYYRELYKKILSAYRTETVYPPSGEIFRAFYLTPLEQVKAVILGQDPYHQPGQAHGLCFSVNDGVQFPPSLLNIFKELKSDLGVEIPQSGNLTRWAQQGVLLLNATLTVREHQAGSHQNRGWEQFTDAVIQTLSEKKSGLVFILWGSYAQSKARLIDSGRHCILRSAHPSPLSAYRGFFGNHHFSLTNDYLSRTGKSIIKW